MLLKDLSASVKIAFKLFIIVPAIFFYGADVDI